jgi:hypothetical protein
VDETTRLNFETATQTEASFCVEADDLTGFLITAALAGSLHVRTV